jgi:hypothetical protein
MQFLWEYAAGGVWHGFGQEACQQAGIGIMDHFDNIDWKRPVPWFPSRTMGQLRLKGLPVIKGQVEKDWSVNVAYRFHATEPCWKCAIYHRTGGFFYERTTCKMEMQCAAVYEGRGPALAISTGTDTGRNPEIDFGSSVPTRASRPTSKKKMPPKKAKAAAAAKAGSPPPKARGKRGAGEDAEEEESMGAAASTGEGEGADAAAGSACHKFWGEKGGNTEDIALGDLVRADDEKQIRCAACCPLPPAGHGVHDGVPDGWQGTVHRCVFPDPL